MTFLSFSSGSLASLLLVVTAGRCPAGSGGESVPGCPAVGPTPPPCVCIDTEGEEDKDSIEEALAKIMFYGTIGAVAYGGLESYYNLHPEAAEQKDFNAFPRKSGSFMTPYLRLDGAYLSFEDDLDSWDLLAEAGNGPFAISARRTWFDPAGEVRNHSVNQLYANLRLSYMGVLELAPGLGIMNVTGPNSDTAFATTLPVKLEISDYAAVEFRPAWSNVRGNDVSDFELSFALGAPHASIKAGYRWLESDNEEVTGTFIGFSLRW